jgi:hypothetical protein
MGEDGPLDTLVAAPIELGADRYKRRNDCEIQQGENRLRRAKPARSERRRHNPDRRKVQKPVKQALVLRGTILAKVVVANALSCGFTRVIQARVPQDENDDSTNQK